MQTPSENYTRNIYTLIGEENYTEVLRILDNELHSFPDSTAIHSIMGYCYWQQEDYVKATASYQKLVQLNPNNDSYKLHLAHCQYKTEQYYEAMRSSCGVQGANYKSQTSLLQAAIRYAEEDIQSAKSILSDADQEDIDIMMDTACILYKEDRFEEALDKYMDVKRLHGFIPEVAYCIALCYYRLNRFPETVQMIAEIKSQASRQHPELLRSLAGDSVDFDAQGLIQKAKDAFVVEAVNLMSSLDYDQRHFKEARDVLRELPNRNEEELDPVTLHNTALVTMEDDPSASFNKLTFLLNQEPMPPETFRNLLLGYCKYDYYSFAADLLAENTDMALKTMGQPMLDFLDAYLLCATSKEEAYRKFDELCKTNADILRRLTREVEDSRKTHDDQQQMALTLQFEAAVNDLIPVLMSQAKIFWDLEKYQLVELLLMKYAEFCLDNRTWKLNLAHTYFMEPGKMADAISLYEPLVLGEEHLLDVEAIIVADLCAAYVIMEQNEMADNLINRLTEEEAAKQKEDENVKLYHLSIIHLVIGTLYCAHRNFEFGIDYVFKAFNPMHQKLNADTWFYAKKCLLELIRSIALRQYMIPDVLFDKICTFLDDVDKNGKKIDSIIDLTLQAEEARENQTVSFEARVIKAMLLKMYSF
ncbi:TPR Domain containing protein [Tritrichomonas foetus]|uniref:TPR Domain containing protein n=1 Tax=Tritrichomonas foetus TaxID=1144522 RepID=A0A1J4JHJ9_9EUKA|nr:TPR Domain containing protein [Tritrichomonas foetus]|eukprot:OHS97719.1 TPR Domain containing protein [Tritrichomonas foetus]